jgi:outer membrane protein TolC
MMRFNVTLARTLVAAIALTSFVPSPGALAHAQATATPESLMTPLPMPTASGTPIPYPAYGTPAPDVSAQQPKPGVAATVTVDQAIDIAVAESPAFASERAAYQAIYAKYGAEKGALLPNVSAAGTITRNYGSGGSQNTTGTGTGTGSGTGTNTLVTTEDGRVSLTQLIFDGGRTIAGLRSAQLADVAGRDTLIRELQTLAFNVATAYYDDLEAAATVDADNSIVRENEQQENYVQAQIRTGAAARSDLAAAQFATAQARGALVTAQGQVIAAQATFATTLGLDADAQVNPQTLSSSPQESKTLAYPDAIKLALQLRPDYLAAIYSADSANQNLRFAKLARFPQITANADSGTTRTMIQSPSAMTPWSGNGSIGATISVPIYDQGLTNYNVAVAASQLDQAKAAVLQTKQTVESNVRGALATLISARAGIVQAKAELQSAQVSAQATEAQYRVGATSITAIITAQANLATAQRDYVTAIYTERLDDANYTYSLGNSDLKL